jgi:formylglycine-generating enzyme required for sulfatase activity
MKYRLQTGILACAILCTARQVSAAERVDFSKDVKPILENYCVKCHGPDMKKGGLRLDSRAAAIEGGDNGTSLVPGQPDQSKLYSTTILPPDHDDVMPPKKEPKLTKAQTQVLRLWIEQGAVWPDDVKLKTVRKVDFAKDIQPILELSCVACHREGHAKGGLRLETKQLALKGGDNGPAIVPGKALASPLYTSTVLRPDHEALMPPKEKGGPLSNEQTDLLRDWVNQGALWPEDLVLVPKKAEEIALPDLPVVIDIHKAIMAKLDVRDPAQMKAYSTTIPGTEVSFEMIPIPGGEFLMGSPESEPGRKPDEGPTHKVKIDPFWMGKLEVTWNEYELFMYPDFEKQQMARIANSPANPVADAVSRPTKPYVEMSFGMGKDGYPAISMTQHAANKYCQWLSAKTGHFYRLPTEAEWEYACRAGTTTPYSFGSDASKIGEYAWYAENSDFKYQKVGKKKPNPWGLYDMHGNVAEWCLDGYAADYYKQFVSVLADNPWNKATKPYPHVARGGSWDDDPARLRSAARRASDKSWKQQDPQLPKSIWYLTDAQFLGFRIVRPLKVPSADDLNQYWNSGVERE